MIRYRLRRIVELLTSSTYRRVLLCRIYCYLLNKLNPNITYLGMSEGDETTFLFLRDNVVTPYTVAVGNFARDELLRIIEICNKVGLHLGGAFVDVGANVGTSTLYAMRSGYFSKAISIEPAPSNLKVLRLNLDANGLTGAVHVRANAVSDSKGTMRLALSKENCGDHRILKGQVGPTSGGLDVDVDTLDNIIAAEKLSPSDVSLVWVDTQGHEGYVLAGAEALIQQKVPFCIEFWPQALSEAKCLESLLACIERDFAHFVDLAATDWSLQPTTAIRTFAKKFAGTVYHTDLFLMPRTVD